MVWMNGRKAGATSNDGRRHACKWQCGTLIVEAPGVLINWYSLNGKDYRRYQISYLGSINTKEY